MVEGRALDLLGSGQGQLRVLLNKLMNLRFLRRAGASEVVLCSLWLVNRFCVSVAE